MVILTKGQKRSLEAGGDEKGQKKPKLSDWDPEEKEEFKKNNKNSCWTFAETGECTYEEKCLFNHVTRDGEMVQEAKKKTKTKKKKKKKKKKSKKNSESKVVRKTKEECIAEREIDEEDNIYTGTVKFFKKSYGFISIEEDITFKDITAKNKIYVMPEDIICESEEVGLNKDAKVMFKVYKDSMGLGAMDVTNEDGSPIVYVGEAEKELTTSFGDVYQACLTKVVGGSGHLCLLCRRKFRSAEKLKRHELQSDLHRKNLAMKRMEEPVVKEPTPEAEKPKKSSTKKKVPKKLPAKKTATKKKAVKKTTRRKSVRSKKN